MSDYEARRERELVYQAELMGLWVDWTWWGSRGLNHLLSDLQRWTCGCYDHYDVAAGDIHTSYFIMKDSIYIAVHNWDNTNPWWYGGLMGERGKIGLVLRQPMRQIVGLNRLLRNQFSNYRTL